MAWGLGERGRGGGRRAVPAPGAGQGLRAAAGGSCAPLPSRRGGRGHRRPGPSRGTPGPSRPGRDHRAPSWARRDGNSFIGCSVMGLNSGFVRVGLFGLGFCLVCLFISFSFSFFFFCPPEMDTEVAAACFPLQLSVC